MSSKTDFCFFTNKLLRPVFSHFRDPFKVFWKCNPKVTFLWAGWNKKIMGFLFTHYLFYIDILISYYITNLIITNKYYYTNNHMPEIN